jgi:hypothetical protein
MPCAPAAGAAALAAAAILAAVYLLIPLLHGSGGTSGSLAQVFWRSVGADVSTVGGASARAPCAHQKTPLASDVPATPSLPPFLHLCCGLPAALQAGLFSAEQLARFDGRRSRRVYLAVLGSVFDVTPGARHYGGCWGWEGRRGAGGGAGRAGGAARLESRAGGLWDGGQQGGGGGRGAEAGAARAVVEGGSL